MTETAAPGFDPDSLRARYRAERDKRLRADGNAQYIEMKGAFAQYLEDPYCAPVTREPRTDEVEVAIIGGGFGGLLAGAELRRAGIEGLCLIEKGGDFGGTWYWNRYPGAACDVESYIYLPMLEELGRMPSRKYAPAPEILAHCRALGEHFDLYRDTLFQTEVKALRWDPEALRWTIETNRGDALRARFVIMANGPLHRPKLPGIPGVESFAGHAFHTSRWDYAYTGGDSNGNLSGLADKVVGIIGTGATAVQCVPHLAAGAKHLYVFQRTPSSIDVRNDRPTDPAWARMLEPGWQQRRMDNFNILVSGGMQDEDLVGDGWTEIIRNLILGFGAKKFADRAMTPEQLVELADFEKMESVRARVDAVVRDRETAEALKPYYRQFCKRPCFHDEYLQAFNRPNVTLVDTNGRGVDRIVPEGVVANGRTYALDCLIYATGFEVGTDYTRRSGYELHGEGGRTLTQAWANGMRTLHSMHVHGFPNVLIFQNSQGGFAVNFPHMIREQARHAAYIIRHCRDHQVRRVEATPEAEGAWVQTIKSLAMLRRRFLEECTPGYYNNEGKPSERAEQDGPYGAGPIAFVKVLEDWRAKGDLAGLTLT